MRSCESVSDQWVSVPDHPVSATEKLQKCFRAFDECSKTFSKCFRAIFVRASGKVQGSLKMWDLSHHVIVVFRLFIPWIRVWKSIYEQSNATAPIMGLMHSLPVKRNPRSVKVPFGIRKVSTNQFRTMLTHWDRNQRPIILQKTFSNAFSWKQIYEDCSLRFN